MTRKALRANPQKKPPSFTSQEPAPVKGWMSQASFAEADDQSAVIMTNFFPEAETIRARHGHVEHVTGISGEVQSLLRFVSATNSKLFAAAGSNIYDATASGAVGSAVLSGKTNAWWQQVMFATAAGQFLVTCNGADGVWTYDGTTWTDRTAGITGTSALAFINVASHKRRLWFVPINSMDIYYLDTEAITGIANKFPVGSLFEQGGYVMALGTFSTDTGEGMDDLFVVITSRGELAVYQGTDPSSVNTWSLVGTYQSAEPIGRRCLYQAGGDLMIITEDGVMPFSKILKTERPVAAAEAATKNIRQAYTDASRRARHAMGWEIVASPFHNMALVNVPASGTTPVQQFAFNLVTGAWALFEGYNANCWAHFDPAGANALFFGGAGKVFRAEYGANDNGQPIILKLLPAFMHFKSQGKLKHVKDYRWYITTDLLDTSFETAMAIDYREPESLGLAGAVGIGSNWFQWDVTPWDGPAVWYGEQTFSHWTGAANVGTVLSPYFRKALDAGEAGADFKFHILASDYIYEPGGVF